MNDIPGERDSPIALLPEDLPVKHRNNGRSDAAMAAKGAKSRPHLLQALHNQP